MWTFSKYFFAYQADQQLLFDGKLGVLFDAHPYTPNPNDRHAIDSFSMIAISGKEYVFFVSLDPPGTLKQTIMHAPYEKTLPCVAWRLSYSTNPSLI